MRGGDIGLGGLALQRHDGHPGGLELVVDRVGVGQPFVARGFLEGCGGIGQDRLRLLAQRVPFGGGDVDAKVGLEDRGFQPDLQELVPAPAVDGRRRIAHAVEGASFQPRVDIRHRHADRHRAKAFVERVVQRRGAQAQPGQVEVAVGGQRRLFQEPQVDRCRGGEACQDVDAQLFRPDLLHQGKAAIFARDGGVEVAADPGVRLRHRAQGIAERAIGHVDHAPAHGLDLLQAGHGLGSADHVDPHHAGTLLVHLGHEAVVKFRRRVGRGEGGQRPQHVLGVEHGAAGGGQKGRGEQRTREAGPGNVVGHGSLLWVKVGNHPFPLTAG